MAHRSQLGGLSYTSRRPHAAQKLDFNAYPLPIVHPKLHAPRNFTPPPPSQPKKARLHTAGTILSSLFHLGGGDLGG